jgi:glycosyltransferase involved in cell wall biosynthesis
MAVSEPNRSSPPLISIGILAYNEEDGIKTMLESLFKQTLFAELERRGEWCEVICVANGCVDDTVEVTRDFFGRNHAEHPNAGAFSCQVEEIVEKGKSNALNHYYHRLSHPDARFLLLMDADILFYESATLHSLTQGLIEDQEAWVTVGQIYKDIYFKENKTTFDRISLATSTMTRAGTAQLSGQLYCIRSSVARNIYFPRGILNEDGFIKLLVCNDFYVNEFNAKRIKKVEQAAHIFESYKSISDIMNIQKREMTSQVIYNVFIEIALKRMDSRQRSDFADSLRQKEKEDPNWLLKDIADYMQQTRYFWRIFPNALTFRLRRLWSMSARHRITHLPTALAATLMQTITCYRAYQALKDGSFGHWPDTKSQNLGNLKADGTIQGKDVSQ